MEKLTIAVGTISDQKIKYLKDVLRELKIKSEIIAVDVKSGIAEQPKTSEETERGSKNRANGAFKKSKDADFAIGIEVGYHKGKNGYEMFCWVTIIDNNGYQISSQSHKFLLPEYYQNILNKEMFLGDNLDGYYKDKKNYIKKHIDDIVRYREPFIKNALNNALLRYLNKEDF